MKCPLLADEESYGHDGELMLLRCAHGNPIEATCKAFFKAKCGMYNVVIAILNN